MAQMVKNLPTMKKTQVQSRGQEDPWKREWLPTPVFLPGEFHRRRSLERFIFTTSGVSFLLQSQMWGFLTSLTRGLAEGQNTATILGISCASMPACFLSTCLSILKNEIRK